MKKYLRRTFIVYLIMRMAIGCGTIIHGTTQDIQVASVPTSSEVWVDGSKMGETPTKVNLKRGDSHLIRVVKEGYEPVEVYVEKSTSAWIIGNIIFGGIIGCGIDFLTGGAYDLAPERLDVNLPEVNKETSSITLNQSQVSQLKEIRFLGEDNEEEIVLNIEWED